MKFTLKVKKRLPWFTKEKITVMLIESRKESTAYGHGHLNCLLKIFQMIVEFHKLARQLKDASILGSLCAVLCERLAKERELHDKYRLLQTHTGFTEYGKNEYIERCDKLLTNLGYSE